MQNRLLGVPTMQNKVRFNDISILRVSAMLMVVFYHCLCPYSIWDGTDFYIGFHVPAWDVVDGMLAQIHLPIFFLISGYLYGYKRIRGGYNDNVKFLKDKALRVLAPYVIVGLFLCLLQDRDILQMLCGISHLWFLLVIYECYLFGKIIERVLWLPSGRLVLIGLAAVVLLLVASYRIPQVRFLAATLLVRYFPYYLIGMLASKMDFSLFARCKHTMVVGLFLVIACSALQRVYLNRAVLATLLGLALVALLFCVARCTQIDRVPSWAMSLDKCSMGIYIVHHVLIQEMNGLCVFHEMASEYYYVYPLVQFVLITLISWGFVAICRRKKYSKYILG